MNKAVLAILALLLGASAANAATATATNGAPDPAAQTRAAPSPKVRQQIQDQLTKAGLTDIKIAPEEYVVHAKNKQGNPVTMIVTPNSFLEMTDVKVSDTDKVQGNRSQAEPTPTAKQ